MRVLPNAIQSVSTNFLCFSTTLSLVIVGAELSAAMLTDWVKGGGRGDVRMNRSIG